MARRIPGEFVPCDVNLASDPAILRAGPFAELVYRRALEYVKRTGRDGQVYAVELPLIAHGIPGKPATHAAALVQQGLWQDNGDGWLIRSWTKWNLTQEEQAEERDRKRLAAVLTNHKRYHKAEPHPDCPHCKEEAS